MDDTSLHAAGADEGGENQGQSAQVPAASGQDTDARDVTVIPRLQDPAANPTYGSRRDGGGMVQDGCSGTRHGGTRGYRAL